MSSSRTLRRLVATTLTVLMCGGQAQATDGFSLGVIVSRSGAAASAGASQTLAVTAWQAALRATGGVFGVAVDVELIDDGGSAARALDAAMRLIAEGVHALVCCTTNAASREVAPLAQQSGILMLSPAQLDNFGLEAVTGPDSGWGRWAFSLSPSDVDALAGVVAHALASGLSSVALMTLDNEFSDSVLSALASLVGFAGMRLVDTVRYSPSARELRPEALLLASRQPGAVIVWGLREDLATAVIALRRRGFEGAIYARTALLAPEAQSPSWGVLADVRFAVTPAKVASSLLPSQPCAADVGSFAARLNAAYGGVADFAHAAPMIDALALLEGAIEQVVALQIPIDRPEVVRQALRDGAVGLSPRCGANGLIDLLDDRESAIVPRGLVAAAVGPTGLLALP